MLSRKFSMSHFAMEREQKYKFYLGFKEGIAGLDAFTWVLPSISFCYASGG